MKTINTARVLRAASRRARSLDEYDDLVAELNDMADAEHSDSERKRDDKDGAA